MKERWRKIRCFFGYHPEFSVVTVSVLDQAGNGPW